MNQSIMAILIFALLLITILSPLGALSALMLFLLVPAFLWMLWTVVDAAIGKLPQDSASSRE